MKKFFKWLIIVVLVFVVLPITWTLVQDYFSGYSWHQKLTIEVETPSGLKTGSSVVFVSIGKTSFIPGQPGGAAISRLRGEAAVVEIAPGRYLFALLGGQKHLAQKVFDSDIPRGQRTFKNVFGRFPDLRETRSVSTDLIPLLVTFTDINDPMSVQKVSPNDMSKIFGPNYRLKSIMLEITEESVTMGRIDEVLDWLAALEGGYLHGGSSSRGAPLGLYGSNFKNGG